jgi:hypothetical protein
MKLDLGISSCTSLERDSTLLSGCRFPELEKKVQEVLDRLDKHMEEFHTHDISESSTSDKDALTTYSGSRGDENWTGAPINDPFPSKDRFLNDLYPSKLKELEGFSTKDWLDAFSSKAKELDCFSTKNGFANDLLSNKANEPEGFSFSSKARLKNDLFASKASDLDRFSTAGGLNNGLKTDDLDRFSKKGSKSFDDPKLDRF